MRERAASGGGDLPPHLPDLAPSSGEKACLRDAFSCTMTRTSRLTRTDQKLASFARSSLWSCMPGEVDSELWLVDSWRSKDVVFTAFCSSPVRRERLSVKVSEMRKSMPAGTPLYPDLKKRLKLRWTRHGQYGIVLMGKRGKCRGRLSMVAALRGGILGSRDPRMHTDTNLTGT